MTTIAYRDGVLAGDGRVADDSGHIWRDDDVKVFRLPDGSLFGGAGDGEGLSVLLKHMCLGHYRVLPKLDGADVVALHIRKNGSIYLTEGLDWSLWRAPYIAIGSGRSCALTALRLGHSARAAVKAGIAGDMHSGGKITVVKLKRKK